MSESRVTSGDRALFVFFALFLFTSTFSIAISQICLGCAGIVFVGLVVARRYNPFRGGLRWFYLAAGAYIAWMVLSSQLGATPGRSVVMVKEDWLFLIVPIGVYLFRHRQYRRQLPLVLGAGVLVMASYGIVQHFTGLHWPNESPPPEALAGGYFAEGTFAHHLTYGNYFAVATCFVLAYALLGRGTDRFRERVVLMVAALLGLAATVLSYARTAVAALPVTLLLLSALKGKKWFGAALMAVVVGGIAAFLFVPGVAGSYEAALNRDFAGESQAARMFIWKKSLGIVGEHPVFGVGQGNFPEAYSRQNDPDRGENRTWPHAHNDLLNIAALAGIPGALLFVGLWVSVLYYFVRGWRRLRGRPVDRALIGAAMTGALIFALCSVTEAAFADEEVRQLLMFVWAAGLWPVSEPDAMETGSITS